MRALPELLRERFRREDAAIHADGFITVADAMQLLGLHRLTVDKMIRDGRLRAVRRGRRWVTTTAWVAGAHRGHRAVAPEWPNGYGIDPRDLDAWAPRARKPRHNLASHHTTAAAWRCENGWLSVAEAAELLGITRSALQVRIQSGQQEAVRAGADAPVPGAWLIRREDVGRRAA